MSAAEDRLAEALAHRINERLERECVLPGDFGNIGVVVFEIAPGWDWRDASVVGVMTARVILTTYEGSSPL